MTRRLYAKLYATAAEVRTISAAARRRKLSLSDYVRGAIGLSSISADQDRPLVRTRGAAAGSRRALKISLRNTDERDKIIAVATEADASTCDYLRMAAGLSRLREARGCGAPRGNRNSVAFGGSIERARELGRKGAARRWSKKTENGR